MNLLNISRGSPNFVSFSNKKWSSINSNGFIFFIVFFDCKTNSNLWINILHFINIQLFIQYLVFRDAFKRGSYDLEKKIVLLFVFGVTAGCKTESHLALVEDELGKGLQIEVDRRRTKPIDLNFGAQRKLTVVNKGTYGLHIARCFCGNVQLTLANQVNTVRP